MLKLSMKMEGGKMKIEAIIIVVIMAVIAFITFYIIGKYNKLKLYESRIINKWNAVNKLINEKIEVLLKTITFLREHIKEEEVTYNDIKIIIDNYNKLTNANDKINEYSNLEDSFDRLYKIVETNSKINSDVEYNMLKEENNSVNSKIEYSKEFYNNEVNVYNSKTSSFISNLVVKMFSFNRYNIFR